MAARRSIKAALIILVVYGLLCFASPYSWAQANTPGGNADGSALGGKGGNEIGSGIAVPSDAGIASALKAAGLNSGPGGVERAETIISGGGPSPEQMQRLCAGVAAKQVSPANIESVGASLGLSSGQIKKLKACAEGKAGTPGSAGGPKTKSASETFGQTQQAVVSPVSGNLSSIEASFRQLSNPVAQAAPPVPNNLRQFGYALFKSRVSTFAPVSNVPVGTGYILGPGDGLNVLLWGRVNHTYNLKVQRDGTVLMPVVGPVEVAGLSFEQAKKLIESRAGQITGVHVDVTMGPIRTIQVFIIGKVNHPGLYTVSALSHVSNALVAAGGISKIGSLRRIELRRHGKVIRTIDLYNMLLHGSTVADVNLQQGDVIFVPVIGPVVGVAGDVKDPAIYELKGHQDLKSVLDMAGGVGAFGYFQRIQVERIENHKRRIALDVTLAHLGKRRFQIHDGDLIKVFTVLPQEHNVVTLKGNVNRPGLYQWHAGMKVADLIRRGEGVSDNTFFSYALIKRIEGPDRRVHFLPVNLGEALEHPDSLNADITLKPHDTLTIYNERDLADLPKVSVIGAVRSPGSYPLTEGMRVSDLVYEARGLRDNAYLPRARLARTRIVNGAARYIYENVDLKRALGGSPTTDPLLASGDKLFIQTASNWHAPWTITVEGEVMRPGPYVIREGERLDSVIKECGGLRTDAYLPAAVFIRRSLKEMEQKQLNQARQRLKAEIARLSLMPAQAGNNQSRQKNLEMAQQFLASSGARQAVGRLVLHLTSLPVLARSHDDLVLENGDRLFIPERPASVAVQGEVYNPGAIIFEPGQTVGDYLNKVGGPTEWGDHDHIFLIRANGEVVTDESIRQSGAGSLFPLLPALSGGLMGVRLQRGDTIYVPEQLVYVDKLHLATAVTQIISNTAESIAVIGILGTHL